MTAPTPCLVVCALDVGCYTRDGTLQPKGTAFDRVVTNPDGSDYAPPPGCVLVKDDDPSVVLYVQNSGGRAAPPTSKHLKTYTNNADAASHAAQDGLKDGDWYLLPSGYATQYSAP